MSSTLDGRSAGTPFSRTRTALARKRAAPVESCQLTCLIHSTCAEALPVTCASGSRSAPSADDGRGDDSFDRGGVGKFESGAYDFSILSIVSSSMSSSSDTILRLFVGISPAEGGGVSGSSISFFHSVNTRTILKAALCNLKLRQTIVFDRFRKNGRVVMWCVCLL